ncbi:hypothetical protein L228DRAFT_261915 [Xylona heveae TC161]|uniref:histone acetyltransferase n=1 Tax=Xylona heveae (strain CBS 132557 / TC161) TaxID=1328760 RepID=A0A165G675_XYLHT|nr:hypothetical protein L228DRAFT_261915 [Xylona heveae TC161]KZF21786.1 hypothetical protein L228DRAFT_261915 [Xylona heveae TC161]
MAAALTMQNELPSAQKPRDAARGDHEKARKASGDSTDGATTAMTKDNEGAPNIRNVVLGDLLFRTWYPSFYPDDLVGRDLERLYVCRWCFKYSRELIPFLRHLKACDMKHTPPSDTLVYAKENYSLYMVDGQRHKLFTQNLSLFAKLFLDNKSVFYDVSGFLYYLLVQTDPVTAQRQVVGFFSKEKMSWDNNNLACILIFPPWQRRGLGQMLMGVSYELSRREKRIGGPEKPLSDLGRRAYLSFWSATIARLILSASPSSPQPKGKVAASEPAFSVKDISDITYILIDDIIATLKEMKLLGREKRVDGSIVISKESVRQWANRNRIDLRNPVDPEAFLEKPPPEGEEDDEEGEGNEDDEEMEDEEDDES